MLIELRTVVKDSFSNNILSISVREWNVDANLWNCVSLSNGKPIAIMQRENFD